MGMKKKEKKKQQPDPELSHIEAENKSYIESQSPAEDEANEPNIGEKKKKKKKKKKETIDVKIHTLREQPDKISPIVGYFPTGFDPLKNGSIQSDPPDHSVRVYRHVKRNNRLQVIVKPNGSEVDFVGTSYSGEAAAPQLCTYALGVLDKAAQTLKIVPIAANKIFRLEPKLEGSNKTPQEAQTNLKEELNEEEKAKRSRETSDLFLTKKAINKRNKHNSLRQKEDPKSQEDLDRTLEEITINMALEVAATTNERNIPPHDMSASTPKEAYPIEKIIFEGEWDYLKDLLERSERAEITPDAYPTFVCNRVHKLGDIKNEYQMSTVACIFSYITHLIMYKDKHSMDGFSSAKNHKCPDIFSQKFRVMFGDSKRLSDEKRNLLISYVLVLSLFVDDYRSDPSDIAKDLRMSLIELRTHFNQLGCKFVNQKNGWVATLPVPLKFPDNIRRKRRR